jgi:hypothetical protein
MSEPIKTEEECTKAGGTWNAEAGTCTMPSTAEKGTVIATVEKGNLNLEQRIMGVMKDVIDAKIVALEKALDEKIDAILKSKEIEMEQALRKGFGLENDPVIHQSDLVSALRKASLAQSEPSKKTPAAVEKAGPEGNKPTNALDAVFDKYTEGKN